MGNKYVQNNRIDIPLSPRQAAEAIGVSVSSLKRWCDQGKIPMLKTVGGHRRIPRSAVIEFLRARGSAPKHAQILGLPANTSPETRSPKFLKDLLINALLDGDERSSTQIIMGLYLANFSSAQIGDDFIRPVFETIGQLWHQNDLEIYQEHRASEVMQQSLYQLSHCISIPNSDAPLALNATLQDTPYSIAILLADIVFKELGWRTTYLGTNHPHETLIAALRDIQPRVFCLAVSFRENHNELIQHIELLYEEVKRHKSALVIGGNRLSSEVKQNLSCTAICDSMKALSELAIAIEPSLREESKSKG